MNLQEKKDYVLENLHFVPEEEKTYLILLCMCFNKKFGWNGKW